MTKSVKLYHIILTVSHITIINNNKYYTVYVYIIQYSIRRYNNTDHYSAFTSMLLVKMNHLCEWKLTYDVRVEDKERFII